MIWIPPIRFSAIWLPYLVADTPLSREYYLFAVHDPDKPLFPSVANDPLHVILFEWAELAWFAEIGEYILAGTAPNRPGNHLVV